MTKQPKIPKKVTIDQAAMKVFIDGEEFPWPIVEGGLNVVGLSERDRLPGVVMEIVAENVEILPRGEQ